MRTTDLKGPGYDLIDAVFANLKAVQEIADQMKGLAFALERVGMERPAQELFDMRQLLVHSAKTVVTAHSAMSSDRLSEQQKGIGRIFTTLLNNVETG
jgi:hypothetical protein